MKFADDEPTLAKLNSGDKSAFLEVYEVYAPKLFRYAYNKVNRDRSVAEDITQHTFFKTWEYIVGSDKKIKNIQAFLYRVARNAIIDHWRKKDKDPAPLNDKLMARIEITEGIAAWDDELAGEISLEALERGMNKLPEIYKDILMLRYMEELEIDAISTILDKEKNNTYVLLHRAMAKLKQVLEDELKED